MCLVPFSPKKEASSKKLFDNFVSIKRKLQVMPDPRPSPTEKQNIWKNLASFYKYPLAFLCFVLLSVITFCIGCVLYLHLCVKRPENDTSIMFLVAFWFLMFLFFGGVIFGIVQQETFEYNDEKIPFLPNMAALIGGLILVFFGALFIAFKGHPHYIEWRDYVQILGNLDISKEVQNLRAVREKALQDNLAFSKA
jgi:hypothetical protein